MYRPAVVELLIAAFIIILLTVGGKKGARAIIALGLSALIILKVATPLLLAGTNPLLVALAGGIPIIALIVFLTEGFSECAAIAAIAIVLNFGLTILVSGFFVHLAQLSGFSSEEVGYVAGAARTALNLQQLLLAGIVLSSLGILTEAIVGQVAAVETLAEANPTLDFPTLYKKSYAIGLAHLGSIINTLFLIYAGVSLPLILVLAGSQTSLTGILSNELVITEIIRVLTGAIGIALSMPITTALASRWWQKKRARPGVN